VSRRPFLPIANSGVLQFAFSSLASCEPCVKHCQLDDSQLGLDETDLGDSIMPKKSHASGRVKSLLTEEVKPAFL
jgi:hypothetical protein